MEIEKDGQGQLKSCQDKFDKVDENKSEGGTIKPKPLRLIKDINGNGGLNDEISVD